MLSTLCRGLMFDTHPFTLGVNGGVNMGCDAPAPPVKNRQRWFWSLGAAVWSPVGCAVLVQCSLEEVRVGSLSAMALSRTPSIVCWIDASSRLYVTFIVNSSFYAVWTLFFL